MDDIVRCNCEEKDKKCVVYVDVGNMTKDKASCRRCNKSFKLDRKEAIKNARRFYDKLGESLKIRGY